MCLAELQLQQDSAASSSAALGKACSCASKLQDCLTGDMCTTSSCYKLAIEVSLTHLASPRPAHHSHALQAKLLGLGLFQRVHHTACSTLST
jgi:hypothetical protein